MFYFKGSEMSYTIGLTFTVVHIDPNRNNCGSLFFLTCLGEHTDIPSQLRIHFENIQALCLLGSHCYNKHADLLTTLMVTFQKFPSNPFDKYLSGILACDLFVTERFSSKLFWPKTRLNRAHSKGVKHHYCSRLTRKKKHKKQKQQTILGFELYFLFAKEYDVLSLQHQY